MTDQPGNWRLLLDEPAGPAWNMAVDEAILEAHASGEVPPTVRFYAWRPATVSLGYFQELERELDTAYCAQEGIAIVRRCTGGRAVLHETDEVTYSLVISTGILQGPVVDTYREISQGLALGLSELGVQAELKPLRAGEQQSRRQEREAQTAACFDVPSDYELVAAGRKLAGSAQTRRDGAILQHGALLVRFDPSRLAGVIQSEMPQPKLAAALAARATSLQEQLGQLPSRQAIITALAQGLASHFGVRLDRGRLTPGERSRAEQLAEEKYGNDVWTNRH